MAEANIRLHNESLVQEHQEQQEQQNSGCLVSGLLHDNKFFSRLHENLDFNQLFNTFINELRSMVPCDSIEYENKETQSFLVNGSAGRHHCEYTLKHEGLSLGVIRVTRDRKLLNHELEIIETMLAGLTLPLHNALRHQEAIRLEQRDELTG